MTMDTGDGGLCQTHTQLGADRTTREDVAFLPNMVLPLTIFDNVANHAEDERAQRCLTNAAQHGGQHAPLEAVRVQHENQMADNHEGRTCQNRAALAQPAAQEGGKP